jgi:hypothetical protein
MVTTLLKAKAWQLFILTFGIPIAMNIILMIAFFIDIASQAPPASEAGYGYLSLFPLVVLPFAAIFYAWLWAVAVGLQNKVPEHVTLKYARFKLLFRFMAVYLCFFVAFFFYKTSGFAENNPGLGMPGAGSMMALIFLFHMFAMFCILYTFYFVAKTLKTVEMQREATFSDYAGEFFLIWFYPIGIWIIQPKINEIMEYGVFQNPIERLERLYGLTSANATEKPINP